MELDNELDKKSVRSLNRLSFEGFLAGLSSDFINLTFEKSDSRINEALARVGSYMNVDRSFVFQFNWDKTEFRISHLWEVNGIFKDAVVRGVLVKDHFPWLANKLMLGQDVIIEDAEKLRNTSANREFEYCQQIGIRSFLILPVQVEGSSLCAIGIDSIRKKRRWSDNDLKRLRLLGEIFGNAIARKHSDIKLRKAYDDIKRLKDQLEAESAYLQEEIRLEHNFENIIGESEGLKYVLFRVEQVAPTDSPVLILGETGTGKELIARAVHKLSSRGTRALVKVNCATLPQDLVEGELFGHKKGAYTGATTRQIGRFELANGSSLFLDEIGEMPYALQAKLLRVLESGEFERLGNPRTLRSNVRIIASTNRDVEEEIRKGRFREDLWYRLKVLPITLPPLRHRKEDIPLLVSQFSDHFAKKMGKPSPTISKSVMKSLQKYPWPGNIRELKHAVERAVITERGNQLKFEFLKSADYYSRELLTFEEMERDYIQKVLKSTKGKIQGPNSAASILKMHPNTLRTRMKKLGIKKRSFA